MKNIGNFLLAIVFLMSSVGINIHKHYCRGELSDVSLYLQADCPCGDVGMNSDCCKTSNDCFKLADDFTLITYTVEFNQILLSFIENTEISLESTTSFSISKYANYKPPLIERDIPVLIQSFLI
jgi:hypothetical protein